MKKYLLLGYDVYYGKLSWLHHLMYFDTIEEAEDFSKESGGSSDMHIIIDMQTGEKIWERAWGI